MLRRLCSVAELVEEFGGDDPAACRLGPRLQNHLN